MISNLARLKKMHQEKPYLYEAEEHAVLKLAEDAIEFIETLCGQDGFLDPRAEQWLKEHK